MPVISMFYGIIIYLYYLKLIQAWIEIHQDELMANWDLAIQGESIFKIDPLK